MIVCIYAYKPQDIFVVVVVFYLDVHLLYHVVTVQMAGRAALALTYYLNLNKKIKKCLNGNDLLPRSADNWKCQ